MVQKTKIVIIAAVVAFSFGTPALAASNAHSKPSPLGDPLSPAACGGGSIGYNILAEE